MENKPAVWHCPTCHSIYSKMITTCPRCETAKKEGAEVVVNAEKHERRIV